MLYQWLKRRAWIFDFGIHTLKSETGQTLPGWGPQMFVFSMFACTVMLWCSLKLPLAWPFALLDIAATIFTHQLLKRSAKQLYRMGWKGFSRPRWWVELSAAFCTATMGLFVTSLSQVNPVFAAPGLVNAIAELCFELALITGWGFLLTAAVGMLLGQILDRPVRGRAIELVAPTFWFVFLMRVIDRAPDAWIEPIILGLAMIAVTAALTYFHYERDNESDVDDASAIS